jgi:hypothetical protein
MQFLNPTELKRAFPDPVEWKMSNRNRGLTYTSKGHYCNCFSPTFWTWLWTLNLSRLGIKRWNMWMMQFLWTPIYCYSHPRFIRNMTILSYLYKNNSKIGLVGCNLVLVSC